MNKIAINYIMLTLLKCHLWLHLLSTCEAIHAHLKCESRYFHGPFKNQTFKPATKQQKNIANVLHIINNKYLRAPAGIVLRPELQPVEKSLWWSCHPWGCMLEHRAPWRMGLMICSHVGAVLGELQLMGSPQIDLGRKASYGRGPTWWRRKEWSLWSGRDKALGLTAAPAPLHHSGSRRGWMRGRCLVCFFFSLL